jgi:hexokinase
MLVEDTSRNNFFQVRISRILRFISICDLFTVITDIEWGAFGDNGVPDFTKTDYDRKVDDNSLIINSFTFEKYISGKYLGEIVRVIVVKLVKDCVLLEGIASDALLTTRVFTTSFVSLVEQDTVGNSCDNTPEILDKLELSYDADDIAIMKYIHVCETVSNRAALLMYICTATLLERLDRPNTTTAVIFYFYLQYLLQYCYS